MTRVTSQALNNKIHTQPISLPIRIVDKFMPTLLVIETTYFLIFSFTIIRPVIIIYHTASNDCRAAVWLISNERIFHRPAATKATNS